MKKNGFTLIELLAVIVILAIIALIATPIILGIINDAREESNERSVELYASAVRNGIAAYQLREGKEVEAKTYKSSELTFIEYDGDVECNTIEYYADGKIYVADCTVNDLAVEYTYGTKQTTQLFKPQYYSWSDGGKIGDNLPSDADRNVSAIDTKGYPFYLGLDADSNNKVSAVYVCFTRNATEYCLKSDVGYETNKIVLEEAFEDTDCQYYEGPDGPYAFECTTEEPSHFYVYVDNSYVRVGDDYGACVGDFYCIHYE